MKTTVDQSRRVELPFEPGDVLDIQRTGPDVLILKRINAESQPPTQLVLENGELVGIGGKRVTTDVVRKSIEEQE